METVLTVGALALGIGAFVGLLVLAGGVDATDRRAVAAEARLSALAAVVDELPDTDCAPDHAEHRTRLADLEQWRRDHETRLKVLEGIAATEMVLIALPKPDVERVMKLLDSPTGPPFAGILADLAAGPKGPFPG